MVAKRGRAFFGVCDFGCTHFFAFWSDFMVCRSCQNKNNDDGNVCYRCGKRLKHIGIKEKVKNSDCNNENIDLLGKEQNHIEQQDLMDEAETIADNLNDISKVRTCSPHKINVWQILKSVFFFCSMILMLILMSKARTVYRYIVFKSGFRSTYNLSFYDVDGIGVVSVLLTLFIIFAIVLSFKDLFSEIEKEVLIKKVNPIFYTITFCVQAILYLIPSTYNFERVSTTWARQPIVDAYSYNYLYFLCVLPVVLCFIISVLDCILNYKKA